MRRSEKLVTSDRVTRSDLKKVTMPTQSCGRQASDIVTKSDEEKVTNDQRQETGNEREATGYSPEDENPKLDFGYKKWGIRGGCLYNWKGKRILIIDNDELNCRLLSIFFKSTLVSIDVLFDPLKIKGYEHVVGKYDLVLMEIYLCGTDGIRLLELLRWLEPDLPVIVQSVLTMPDHKRRCFDIGCAEYYTKPLDMLGLMEVVGKGLER